LLSGANLQSGTEHIDLQFSMPRNALKRSVDAGQIRHRSFQTWSNTMKKIALSSLLVLGLTGAAYAQAATDFASVDADISGTVTLVEAQAAWPDLTEDAFNGADADGSGDLSVEEYNALLAATAAPAS
jgi:outer membrane usher protein FimD/PapC